MAKTMSTVPLCFLKPHWLSDTTSSSRWLVIRLSIMRANIFPACNTEEADLSVVVTERAINLVLVQVDDVGIP